MSVFTVNSSLYCNFVKHKEHTRSFAEKGGKSEDIVGGKNRRPLQELKMTQKIGVKLLNYCELQYLQRTLPPLSPLLEKFIDNFMGEKLK